MSAPTPAVSPYVPFYAASQPYITVDEFLTAPTGVDTSQLVPGATDPTVNKNALEVLISAASSYADTLCFQVLAATSDMQSGEYRIWRDGTIRVPVDYSPLIEISNVAVGYSAGGLAAMSDLSGIWIDRKVVRIPVASLAVPNFLVSGGSATAAAGRVFAQVTYVNGYANTTLAADVAQGASSIVVSSALGVFAGMPLTIYDVASGAVEQVTVAASYVPGSTTVPLVSPLTFEHAAGVSVSALPRAVKQAVIALTTHLIKTRGAESIALSGVSGGPSKMQNEEPGTTEEYNQAVDLLRPFARVR